MAHVTVLVVLLANQEPVAYDEFVAFRDQILAVVAFEARQVIWLIEAVHGDFVGLHWQFTAVTFRDERAPEIVNSFHC